MEPLDSQCASDVLKKVKVVKGYNFITIENTKNLTKQEIIRLLNQPFMETTKNINILVESDFNSEVDHILKKNGFKVHDETVMVRKELQDSNRDATSLYTLKNLEEIPADDFKKVWKDSMLHSLNAPSSLDIDEQMLSVEEELGTNHKRSCMIAYENDSPIGVMIPHIEPGTQSEGRIFFFGLIPRERGKGKSKLLHQQALEILKNDFKATYYIGSTSQHNVPMLQTFQYNGCRIVERNIVYKRENE
ncbi:GNAT family N-acetyltransferase [Rossellomorea aquimaris]|nr:GNAT family N-acetyltransferase [Rossellomorea aquimaris]